MVSQQETDRQAAGEFRGALESAVHPVMELQVQIDGPVQHLYFRKITFLFRLQVFPDRAGQMFGQFGDLAGVGIVITVQIFQKSEEPLRRSPIAVPGGEVRAAEKWLAFRGEPDGHRPASPAGQSLHRGHVDSVQIGADLPVHLYGHIVLVHVPGDLQILERFLLHHVAPVASGIADAEQNRFPLGGRGGKGLVSPWKPVHRIVGVLEKVGTGLEEKAVGECRGAVGLEVMGAGLVIRP